NLHVYTSTICVYSFLMLRPPTCSTLFPYTTLFRSLAITCANTCLLLLILSSKYVFLIAVLTKNSVVANGKKKMLLPNNSISYKRSEEHTSELQSRFDLVCRLLLEKKKTTTKYQTTV